MSNFIRGKRGEWVLIEACSRVKSFIRVELFLVSHSLLYKGEERVLRVFGRYSLISIGMVVESKGEISHVFWSGKLGATTVGPTH